MNANHHSQRRGVRVLWHPHILSESTPVRSKESWLLVLPAFTGKSVISGGFLEKYLKVHLQQLSESCF